MNDASIERILRKLTEVRDRRIQSFGSASHHYELAAPLADEAVAAFERDRGVGLPADYRAFVTRAGESGAGPYYGLLPLSRWNTALRERGSPACVMAKPCLFAPGMPRTDDAYRAAVGDTDEPFQGTMAIVYQGCAYLAVLVVSGPHAGRVAYVNTDGGVPYFVENVDFLSWYERWLDELLWGHVHHWFGMGMAGDEATLAAAASTASSPRRHDALTAMHRLPRLGDVTAAIVAARLGDAVDDVREAALGLVAKFALGGVEAQVRSALEDACARVRLRALLALIATSAGEVWQVEARRALLDEDGETASRAFRELEKAGALSADDLLALLDVSAVASRAMSLLAKVPSERVVAVLLARARDAVPPDPLAALIEQVRGGVAVAAQRDETLALLLARLASGPENGALLLRALGAFVPHHPSALDALIASTRSGDPFLRYEAAAVLGNEGGPEAIEALEALAADPTMPRAPDRATAWSVGENAKKALAKVRTRIGLPAVRPDGPVVA
jgi:hypothetical protein